tara:strand:+ start:578 stop:2377 length:1800 start_codon:yes stop_codon:yes gene_type:complete
MPTIKKDHQIIPVNYTNRDFSSIKNDLLEYAKVYYPDTYKDFSDASFGSFMVDTVAYVGDMLSFYLDYQANESFFETSLEFGNVLKHARQMGYKQEGAQTSRGEVAFYIKVAAGSDGQPSETYMPILRRGTVVTSFSGASYTLVEDIDFGNPNNEIVVASTGTDGGVSEYAVRAVGQVVSGQLQSVELEVGSFERFKRIEIPDTNVISILSVIDTSGHEYVEVDHLSQDVIFKAIPNPTSTADFATSILKTVSVPRRFTTEIEQGRVFMQFGYGSDDQLNTRNIKHSADVLLRQQARDYVPDRTFDPSRILDTDTFGVAPANTTLTIYYFKNTATVINAPARAITGISDAIFRFSPSATSDILRNNVRKSLEVTNEVPIIGKISTPTADEIKRRSKDYFATQSRAVTRQDYMALTYQMPPQFGSIKRCNVVHDNDSFKRNLNMYVLSENINGNLATTNATVKNNLKTYLQRYKMINDTVDILNGKVVNFGISFIAVADFGLNRFDVLNRIIRNMISYLDSPFDLGQTLYISDFYNVINDTIGVVDVVDVKLDNLTSGDYSNTVFDIDQYISADGRYVRVPEDCVLELRYPFQDIKGTIR